MIPAISDDPNVTLTDLFELARPHMDFTYNNVLHHLNTVYVMNTFPGTLFPATFFNHFAFIDYFKIWYD